MNWSVHTIPFKSNLSDLGISDLKVGIVVPTTGERLPYLRQALASIRAAGECVTCVVAINSQFLTKSLDGSLFDVLVEDPQRGLAGAINTGIAALPEHVKLANWLGDDDLLEPQSLELVSHAFEDEKLQLVYGMCRYINANGDQVWVNRAGNSARWIMRFGPQLIPQPGCLFRRDTFDKIGGLDEDLRWAFDLDLMIRLAKQGSFQYLPTILSSFRWHSDSLTVGSRNGSVAEASQVRVRHLPSRLQPLSICWEPISRFAIKFAGKTMSRRVSHIQGQIQ